MASGDSTGRTSAGTTYYDLRIIWNDNGGSNIDTDQTYVYAYAYLVPRNGGFDGYTCNGWLNINGVRVGTDGGTKRWGWTTNGASYGFTEGGTWVTHNADGTKSVSIEAYFDDGTNTVSYTPKDVYYSIGVTLADLSRPPLAPASGPTITRTGTGETIGITSQTAAAYSVAAPATTRYDYQWSTTNAAPWTLVTGTSSTSFPNFTGSTPTTVYYFQTRAANSEGNGAWSPSSSAYAAPSITSLTSVGTTATITVAAASSNGGSTVTGHVVQYSTASNFSSIAGTQTISGATGGTTNIVGLTPGNTYYFRAYATNSASVNSPYSTSQSTFIAAYGRRYQSQAISSASSTTTVATYNSTAHGFSVGDQVTTSGLTPSNLNVTGTIATTSTNSFTINGTFTSGTWTTTGTAAGWALTLTGNRYVADTGGGSPGWVAITTAQKYTAGAFASLSSPAS